MNLDQPTIATSLGLPQNLCHCDNPIPMYVKIGLVFAEIFGGIGYATVCPVLCEVVAKKCHFWPLIITGVTRPKFT